MLSTEQAWDSAVCNDPARHGTFLASGGNAEVVAYIK